MCVCVSVSAFDCPHLDLCPYVRDLCVKLFASPFMRACADLLVCKSASVVCVCVCVCVCLCVCVGGDPCRKAGEGEGAYLHWQLHKGK